MLWSPAIRDALLAETPWLDVLPRMRDEPAIDLRTLDRHPLASVGTLVLGLRCSWCPGSAPMPKLLGPYALPPSSGWTNPCPFWPLNHFTVPFLACFTPSANPTFPTGALILEFCRRKLNLFKGR
jgi:hypothetical protein